MAKEVSKSCRTCLGNNGVEYISIYNGDDNSVVDMLEYILDTQLERTEELPQKVCYECFNDINRCYSFKRKCNNSFKILRNLLDKRKNAPLVMQVKEEPEVNIYDEFFMVENEETQKSPEMKEEMSIKSKNSETETIMKQLSPNEVMQTQQLLLHEENILIPTKISSDSNNANDNHTVQYLIRELNEERDSADDLLKGEVYIRHCASCGAGFAHDTEFNEHMKICPQNKQLKIKKGIQKSQTPEKQHLCSFCDKAFPRPCRLKNHLNKHHLEIRYPNKKSKLKEPVKTKKKHKCPYCDLSFSMESLLKFHLSSHKKEKLIRDSSNKQSLKETLSLNKHLIYDIIPMKYKCKECHMEFAWSSQLQIHMFDHKSKQPNV